MVTKEQEKANVEYLKAYVEYLMQATKAINKALESLQKSAARRERIMCGIPHKDWEQLSKKERDAKLKHWRSQRKYADGSPYEDGRLSFYWAMNWGDRTINQLEALLDAIRYQWKHLNKPTEKLEQAYLEAVNVIEVAMEMPDLNIALYAAQQAGLKFNKLCQGTVKTRKAEKGPRGYAAKTDTWLDVLNANPRWMEYDPEGKGDGIDWGVSAGEVQAYLERMGFYDDNGLPDIATINRTRKRRLKSAK